MQRHNGGFKSAANDALRSISSPVSDKTPGRGATYHARVALLYTVELAEGNAEISASAIQTIRRAAADWAPCLTLAAHCYRFAKSLRGIQPGIQQETPKMLYEPPNMTAPQICTWLTSESRETGMPYFLWDVEEERTRTTVEIIEQLPQGGTLWYRAVSHTWGRWKKHDEPCISLPGVPWAIPQNSKFNVQDLPRLVKGLKCRYLWLDLLCIPQDESNPKMLEIQKSEIARQATIFRHATQVVAWLNDVKNWLWTTATIKWLCFRFLKLTGFHVDDGGLLDELLERFPTGPIELFDQTRSLDPETLHQLPNPWFTSLWTLQELCLRPDIFLCDEKWAPIGVTDVIPISLKDIVALCLANGLTSETTMPGSVQQLRSWLFHTRLQKLHTLTRPLILAIGHDRQCTRRRGEAIMSAVGATEWFRASSGREDNLVLGRYPLTFLNEVRRKTGSAAFFNSVPERTEEFHGMIEKYCAGSSQYVGELDPVGSLLPFGAGGGSTALVLDHVEHPSVEDWIINETGSVNIAKACIVASVGNESLFNDRYCYIAGAGVERQSGNLNDWISNYKPHMPNYAVCTLYGQDFDVRGVLLKEIRRGVFVKVGYFQGEASSSFNPGKVQSVQWLVL